MRKTGFRVFYNTSTKHWDYELTPSESYDDINDMNIWCDTLAQAKECVDNKNKVLVKELSPIIENDPKYQQSLLTVHEIRICKKCKNPFILSYDEWKMFKKCRMVPPKKCLSCRLKKLQESI